jgi:hypothetical protein
MNFIFRVTINMIAIVVSIGNIAIITVITWLACLYYYYSYIVMW